MSALITVRPAIVADAAGIASLMPQLGYTVEAGAMADRLGRLLARDDQRILVAETSGALVGCVHVVIWESIDADRAHGCAIVRLVPRVD